MTFLGKSIRLLLITLLLNACAGTKLERPTGKDIELRATTKSQIIEKFGKPIQENTVSKNNNSITGLAYGHAGAGLVTKISGVTPVHTASFYFFNHLLVGYEYTSNLSDSSTNFDDSQIVKIMRNVTTSSQVISLLGKPSGEHVYPMVKEKEDRAFVYQYSETRGFTPSVKTLIATFNQQGIVTDIIFNKTGIFSK